MKVRPPRSSSTTRRSVQLLGMAALSLGVAAAGALPASATPTAPTAEPELVEVVSSRFPVTDPTHQLSAIRSTDVLAGASTAAPSLVEAKPNKWKTLNTVTGVVMDVDMVNRKVGYAAAELGVIWKTVDGGTTWQQLVNLGFPYYFYGVAALSEDEVVVSGFNNAASMDESAIVWRTEDGGATWSSDITMGPGWAMRTRYADEDHGLINGLIGSTFWHTETGGETESEWTYVQPAPDDGWFAPQFTLLKNLRAYASGISFCKSPNGGVAWTCERSVDDVFDGPTEFKDRKHGWVGGGTIMPDVEGWLHRTTDGGKTWSERVLQTAYPIRQIEALNKTDVVATGGSAGAGTGGISYSTDGGQSWSQDLVTDTEVTACDQVRVKKGDAKRVVCFGFASAGGWHSDTYRATIPVG